MTGISKEDLVDKKELRKWARTISVDGAAMGRIEVDFSEVLAAANYILETLPAPTMDEIDWSDDEHKFAVAVRDRSGLGPDYNVLMLGRNEYSDYIRCLDLEEMRTLDIFDDELTPTGEKYILQGVGND